MKPIIFTVLLVIVICTSSAEAKKTKRLWITGNVPKMPVPKVSGKSSLFMHGITGILPVPLIDCAHPPLKHIHAWSIHIPCIRNLS